MAVEQAIRVTVPLPPSMNNYWRSRVQQRTVVGEDGRESVEHFVLVYLTPEAKAFQEACRKRALLDLRKPFTGDVTVTATVFFPTRAGDLDNRIKPVLDGLEGAAFENDRQVMELRFRREVDPHWPRVEVEVRPVQPSLFG